MGRLKALKPRVGTPPPRVRLPPKAAEPFYKSKAWLGLMARLKRERGNACEDCGAGGPGVRIIGDHIRERKDGGAELDPANIRLLCLPCHNRKTARSAAARARGKS